MMQRPLTIKHKDLIARKLRAIELPYSDLAFGNLYLWRHETKSTLWEYEGVLGVKKLSRDQKWIWVPLDPVPDHIDTYQKLLDQDPSLHLYPIPLDWAHLFPEDKFQIESFEGWSDYVYQTKKMVDYSGRALDGKRNHVKHFLEKYPFRALPFSKPMVKEAIELLKAWKQVHPEPNDYAVCLDALEQFEEIGLSGIILTVEGKVVGFALGQPLTEDIFDLQFAKADISYTGIYPFLYQCLAKTLKEPWINYEFDLGIPGLRKNKTEYAPDHFEVKWRVKRK